MATLWPTGVRRLEVKPSHKSGVKFEFFNIIIKELERDPPFGSRMFIQVDARTTNVTVLPVPKNGKMHFREAGSESMLVSRLARENGGMPLLKFPSRGIIWIGEEWKCPNPEAIVTDPDAALPEVGMHRRKFHLIVQLVKSPTDLIPRANIHDSIFEIIPSRASYALTECTKWLGFIAVEYGGHGAEVSFALSTRRDYFLPSVQDMLGLPAEIESTNESDPTIESESTTESEPTTENEPPTDPMPPPSPGSGGGQHQHPHGSPSHAHHSSTDSGRTRTNSDSDVAAVYNWGGQNLPLNSEQPNPAPPLAVQPSTENAQAGSSKHSHAQKKQKKPLGSINRKVALNTPVPSAFDDDDNGITKNLPTLNDRGEVAFDCQWVPQENREYPKNQDQSMGQIPSGGVGLQPQPPAGNAPAVQVQDRNNRRRAKKKSDKVPPAPANQAESGSSRVPPRTGRNKRTGKPSPSGISKLPRTER